MDTKSPRCSALSKGRPHHLFIEGGPKLAVTSQPRRNRALADCPPYKNRTVRHSNPTARTAMIMCQSRPLEPSRTVRVLLADRPQFRHSEHLWTNLKFEGRTVRTPGADRPPFILKTHQGPNTSLVKKRISLRTVRAPRADRPQFTFQPKPEKQPSGTNLGLADGPSAPHGRAVLRSTLNPTRETPSLVHF